MASNLIGKLHHTRAEAYGPVVLRSKGMTWRSSKSEGGGCLFDYACHAVDLINFLYTIPTRVEGTILNPVFSADVDDEVYSTFFFPDGVTGQLATNWSDESFRKMSMQITIWGTNGRMRIDRQEIQLYLRDAAEPSLGLGRGWNTRYTTKLTEPVWFYLRGEEYSSQIDHFVQCIKNRSIPTISSFSSALETDFVISEMIQDAGRSRSSADAIATAPAQNLRPSHKFVRSIKSMFGHSQSN